MCRRPSPQCKGDLSPLLSGYFDTTTAGSKLEAASYTRILAETGSKEALFISDNVLELYAARQAGMQVMLADRPGNKPLNGTLAKSEGKCWFTEKEHNGVFETVSDFSSLS